ncbi:MAG: hypothetical protein M0R06_10520 [Sphaerochaeta sp.]|jgi:hypothetical protein|nr:hypothetical protein [Sphaerochaeta sp.]
MQEMIIEDVSGLTGPVDLRYLNGTYQLSQVRAGRRQWIKLTPLQAWKIREGIEDMECVRGVVDSELNSGQSAVVVDPISAGGGL